MSKPPKDACKAATQSSHLICVLVKQIDADLPAPIYLHPGDVGADLHAAEDMQIAAGQRKQVRTGIAIALPDGYVRLIHPRSGLAVQHGVTVLNAPGTIDAGYRGEILVNLINHDPVRIAEISLGDRIAQLLIQEVKRARFHIVDELPKSARGAAGHGSTGGWRARITGTPSEPQGP